MPTSLLRLRNRKLLRARFGRLVRSITVYGGPSLFDGSPVELVLSSLTIEPTNSKIGDMAQAWIIARDEHPQEVIEQARKSQNHPVCGDCHAYQDKSCYVLSKYVTSIWRGSRVRLNMEDPSDVRFLRLLLDGFFLRMGAYGDPMAIPAWLWLLLADMVTGHTGYTHAWSHILSNRAKWAPTYKEYQHVLMASVDSEQEYMAATDLGWRSFFVGGKEQGKVCPSFSHDVKCSNCRLCDGLSRGSKRPSITIPAHGARAGSFTPSMKVSDLITVSMPWLSACAG